MSSTRHAPEGAPFSQERFASSEAYNIGLGALLVAKRCELLDDPKLAALFWFLQFRSLPARDGVGGRIGGMNRIAAEMVATLPADEGARCVEDWSEGRWSLDEYKPTPGELQQARARSAADLASELTHLALDPACRNGSLYLRDWRGVLTAYRERCEKSALAKLAQTTISATVWDALEFTRGTAEASLIIGEPRLGKSETAKVFCEAQTGMARYVEVPATNDARSLYKAVAEALGVADGAAYKALQIKERVEEVLRRAKIMLVFDEAQNLWTRNMRPRSAPDRVLWINSLINMGVPVALVALPEFTTWMRICSQQTGWSPKQIEQRITIHRRLPDALTEDDFRTLTRHLAPQLASPAVEYLVSCALEQDGAAFVKKVISAATYRAGKVGRSRLAFGDIEAAVRDDIMPSATTLRAALSAKPTVAAPARPTVSVPTRGHVAPAPQTDRRGIAAALHTAAV